MADAEQILRNLLDKIADEQSYSDPEIKLNKVSTEGANFTSFLFEVTISAKNKDDLNLFAKVAAAGESMREFAPSKVFEVEAFFYEDLLAKYKKLEDDHNIKEEDRLIVPQFYGLHPTLYEETIVLEDLRSKGFTTLGRFELLSWEYASTALKELAKLHALSFALAEENPEGFAEAIAKLKVEWGMGLEQMQQFFAGLVEKGVAMASDENRPRFAQFVSQFSNPELMMKFFMPSKNIMLKHGDYRASNLMHKYNEDGSLTVVPIDYQTIQPGDPLTDLFYLIFTGTDEEFRAKNWQKLLDYYYEQLSAALVRLGLDPDETYSRGTFDESLKEMMPYGFIVALTILPLVTVDQAPEINKDNNINDFLEMKTGDLYRERLNGIINDYIKWGIL